MLDNFSVLLAIVSKLEIKNMKHFQNETLLLFCWHHENWELELISELSEICVQNLSLKPKINCRNLTCWCYYLLLFQSTIALHMTLLGLSLENIFTEINCICQFLHFPFYKSIQNPQKLHAPLQIPAPCSNNKATILYSGSMIFNWLISYYQSKKFLW